LAQFESTSTLTGLQKQHCKQILVMILYRDIHDRNLSALDIFNWFSSLLHRYCTSLCWSLTNTTPPCPIEVGYFLPVPDQPNGVIWSKDSLLICRTLCCIQFISDVEAAKQTALRQDRIVNNMLRM